jgi:hypothetical protein
MFLNHSNSKYGEFISYTCEVFSNIQCMCCQEEDCKDFPLYYTFQYYMCELDIINNT